MPVSSDDIQLTAPAPGPVMGVSAQITGPPGLATYFYWWVATYPIGVTVVSAPVQVRSAPSPLTATNFVTITGRAALGATKYDLLRTNGPNLPSTAANIAVATGLTSPTFNDVGAALTAYSVAGLAAGAPVSAFITLNNRDYAQPTIVMSPFATAVQSLVFPDGSTQTSAGASPYNWTQDVQANDNQLLGLGTLQLISGGATFSFNARVTQFAGTFPAGTLLFQNGTTNSFPLAIDQQNNVTFTGPNVTISNPSAITTLAVQSGTTVAIFSLSTSTLPATFQLAINSANFFLSEPTAPSPNNRIIIPAGNPGKIGLTTGASFTPTHLLQLNVDDAAKPTTNTWTITSDIRTKRNSKPLEGGMTVIEALEPIEAEYNGRADTPNGARVVSFDPDALAKVLPDAVRTARGKLHPDGDETDIAGVNTHEVLFHLVLAVQQLSERIKTLERT